MDDLERKIQHINGFTQLRDALASGNSSVVGGPFGSGAAVVVGALMQELSPMGLVICPGVQYAEEFAEDAAIFDADISCYYPARESVSEEAGGAEDGAPDSDILRSQMKVLRHLLFGPASVPDSGEWFEPHPGTRLVCTSINAVLQPVADPETIKQQSLKLREGTQASPGEVVEWLVEGGFLSMPEVTQPGEYSLRGGILDVFPYGTSLPVRIEFFGDEVDSIRNFDPAVQLSSRRIPEAQILVSPSGGIAAPGQGGDGRKNLLAYLPQEAPVFLVEPGLICSRGEELAGAGRHAGAFFTPAEVMDELQGRPVVRFAPRHGPEAAKPTIVIDCEQRDVFGVDLKGMADEMKRISGANDTYVLCAREAEEERLNVLLEEQGIDAGERLTYRRGRLNHGVVFPSGSMALIPHHRLFGRYRHRRVLRHAEQTRPVTGAEQLSPGDYVVHIQHGIGRFVGLDLLDSNGRKREHLAVEFADGVKIYVPSDRLELVHRYIGVGGKAPHLSKIRGSSWQKKRRKAQKAAEDFSAELLRLQAVRQAKRGIKHPSDDYWQKQFEAEFHYEETPDQLSAISGVKSDMQAPRPMDRLICGDVGYGKTEVAMRAAFKCVMGGRQVAVVAPTTVLAQQHLRTFSERMADYPIRVEMLSRFVSPADAQTIIGAMSEGKVDIVIGTHRLLQKDVDFSDLGLLVVDEEQRFGVKHKERLKRMRTSVDILTLTATPIPRTLHMAMMGLRDISALQTPPPSRRAVETHAARYNPELVRNAILRELNREGQVFFVHNRVHSINGVAERVRKLVPEARVGVGHGQMPEKALAEVMDAFSEGDVDVLISTTIIENGLDIPNANTLIIDRAELLGLAEMHQLRGRVGRYIHKAYAYFLTPQNRPVTPEARSRLEAIQRYCELGAGFDIALRDLELRGAGNILGPEQSGHIAAVGYNLYCRMLSRAQKQMRGEKEQPPPETTLDIGLEAFLDQDYVPSLQQRIEIYRALGDAGSVEKVEQVARNLRDRFGPLPACAENLLLDTELRILAHGAGLDSIQLRNGQFYLGVRDVERYACHFSGAPATPRLIRDEYALLKVPPGSKSAVEAGEYLRDILRP